MVDKSWIWHPKFAEAGRKLAQELGVGYDTIDQKFPGQVQKALDELGDPWSRMTLREARNGWVSIRKVGPDARVERLGPGFREYGAGTGRAKPGAKMLRAIEWAEKQFLLIVTKTDLQSARDVAQRAVHELSRLR